MRIMLRQFRRQVIQPKLQNDLPRTDLEYSIQHSCQVCKHMSGLEEIHQLGEKYTYLTKALEKSANKGLPKV